MQEYLSQSAEESAPDFNLSRVNSPLLAAVPLEEFGFDTSQLDARLFSVF